jgi:hypothetical protein
MKFDGFGLTIQAGNRLRAAERRIFHMENFLGETPTDLNQ